MITGATLIFLVLFVIFGSVTLILYTTWIYPAELNAQATTVVNTILTNQAQATVTHSPQLLYNQLTSKPPSMDTALSSPGEGWVASKQQNGSCAFTNNAYHIHIKGNQDFLLCQRQGTSVTNFVFQVQMTILHGSIGGVFFRGIDQKLAGYMFGITSNGIYSITTIPDPLTSINPLASGRSTAISSGPNLLTVIARGNHLSFYINKLFINSSDDSTFSGGSISLYALHSEFDADTDVAFNNAQLWIL